MADSTDPQPPDLTLGVCRRFILDGGLLLGRVGDDDVLLARAAIDSSRSAPIARTITALSPKAWSSATRFDARCTTRVSACGTGEALRAPALDPIACWRVERQGDRSSCARSCPTSRRRRVGTHAPALRRRS